MIYNNIILGKNNKINLEKPKMGLFFQFYILYIGLMILINFLVTLLLKLTKKI